MQIDCRTNEDGYLLGLAEMIGQGNRYAVESALNAELAMKRHGMRYDQRVIDACREWITEHDFNREAGKGPSPCCEL